MNIFILLPVFKLVVQVCNIMQDLETFEAAACEGLEMLFSAGDSADAIVSTEVPVGNCVIG